MRLSGFEGSKHAESKDNIPLFSREAPLRAFGTEYAVDPRWGSLQRRFIQFFGMVDLPTRVRARAISQILRNVSCTNFLDFGAGTGVYSFFITRDPECSGLAIDVDSDRVDSINRLAADV